MNINQAIDDFVERMRAAGVRFERIDAAPWIIDFEKKLPRRLPRSYFSLLSRYRFSSFEYKDIDFFGNINGHSEDELVIAARLDPYVWEPAIAHGFVPVGRPATGSYDPICFDTGKRTRNREGPVVCLDHEELLQQESARIKQELAQSFLALIEAKE
jgi:hypothetical protein